MQLLGSRVVPHGGSKGEWRVRPHGVLGYAVIRLKKCSDQRSVEVQPNTGEVLRSERAAFGAMVLRTVSGGTLPGRICSLHTSGSFEFIARYSGTRKTTEKDAQASLLHDFQAPSTVLLSRRKAEEMTLLKIWPSWSRRCGVARAQRIAGRDLRGQPDLREFRGRLSKTILLSSPGSAHRRSRVDQFRPRKRRSCWRAGERTGTDRCGHYGFNATLLSSGTAWSVAGAVANTETAPPGTIFFCFNRRGGGAKSCTLLRKKREEAQAAGD